MYILLTRLTESKQTIYITPNNDIYLFTSKGVFKLSESKFKEAIQAVPSLSNVFDETGEDSNMILLDNSNVNKLLGFDQWRIIVATSPKTGQLDDFRKQGYNADNRRCVSFIMRCWTWTEIYLGR